MSNKPLSQIEKISILQIASNMQAKKGIEGEFPQEIVNLAWLISNFLNKWSWQDEEEDIQTKLQEEIKNDKSRTPRRSL